MLVLNKIVKIPFYIGVAVLAVIQSYAMGLLFSGALVALVTATWSAIKPLPLLFTERMWLVYLLSGIPTGLYILVLIVTDLRKSKKHNKQDN